MGSLNMDLVLRVDRLPRPGETVFGRAYVTYPGGKGANQAVAVARLGGRVEMVGRVGEDAFGESLRASLAQEGVGVRWVGKVPGPSGVAFILVDSSGQNQIAVAPGANAGLRPEDLPEEAFEGVRLLLLQLEIPLETVERAAALARARGIAVLLNAAPALSLPEGLWQDTDLLLVNETEAAALLGISPPSHPEEALAAARALAGRGPGVVLTLGSMGAVWSWGGREGYQPAFPVQAVDTTAAGDAFAGALALALAEGRGFEEAMRFASAAGALAATRPGAQPSLPYRPEVEGLLGGLG